VRALSYLILALGWAGWLIPFIHRQRHAVPASTIDRRARWAILLIGPAYALLWPGKFWTRPQAGWQVALGAVFLALACLLSWTSTRALGRQWRLDAGLSPDHELVRSGPYGFIRHPICTSMFCVLIAIALVLPTPPARFLLSLVLFAAGTEIRMRVEDQLLARRFGAAFDAYRKRVPALIPFTKG
jgi:protein-S-isoprenylcysteine O-methyltransferase Ste14